MLRCCPCRGQECAHLATADTATRSNAQCVSCNSRILNARFANHASHGLPVAPQGEDVMSRYLNDALTMVDAASQRPAPQNSMRAGDVAAKVGDTRVFMLV
eukprot:359869-Chlamydomonas_euryale.AAC.37